MVFPTVLMTVGPPLVAALNHPSFAVFAKLAEKSPFLSPPDDELLELEEACVAVGVPLITPELDSDNPDGNDVPLTKAQVNGPVPPLLANVVE